MSTVSKAKAKPCNRCGEQIIWNTQSSFFESLKFPKYQHCCPLTCKTEGCGGTIYFNKLCPVNPDTGNQRPLDHPIPIIDPNNSAQMIWVIHAHKNTVPADIPTTEQQSQAPPVVPETKPLAAGQETLVANVPKEPSNTIGTTEKVIAQAGNQDAQAAILTTLNQMNLRLGALEKYFNDVVPTLTGMMDVMNAIMPKLNVIVGKIADGSITSASDLVQHNLSERQEQNLQ